jgi:hypothetical protein
VLKLDSRRAGIFGILAVAGLLQGGHGLALGVDKGSGASVPFAVATVYLERNATDGDAEVVFEVKGGKEGLAKLTVASPGGRTVIEFTAPDASASLGIRQFRFETPEPRDMKSLTAAYPEGVYTFAGATAAGERLHGNATLSHTLPATASFLRPTGNARGVDARNLKITWSPVENVAAYIVKIEQPKLGVNLTSTLPGSVATFGVPEGFLRPGMQYKLAIGTVSDKGNISFVETTFTTAGRQ